VLTYFGVLSLFILFTSTYGAENVVKGEKMSKTDMVYKCYLCGKNVKGVGSYIIVYDAVYCFVCAKYLNLIK